MSHPIILFDGVCNFCNATVNALIRQDKQKIFRFAALQSEAGQKLLEEYHLPTIGFNSFVLLDKGRVYQKSTAALKVLGKLPWYWKWTQAFRIAPPFLRNAVYDLIARNRYKWFGKRDVCRIPTSDEKERFL